MNIKIIIDMKIEIFLNKISRDDIDLQISIHNNDIQDSDTIITLIFLNIIWRDYCIPEPMRIECTYTKPAPAAKNFHLT